MALLLRRLHHVPCPGRTPHGVVYQTDTLMNPCKGIYMRPEWISEVDSTISERGRSNRRVIGKCGLVKRKEKES